MFEYIIEKGFNYMYLCANCKAEYKKNRREIVDEIPSYLSKFECSSCKKLIIITKNSEHKPVMKERITE